MNTLKHLTVRLTWELNMRNHGTESSKDKWFGNHYHAELPRNFLESNTLSDLIQKFDVLIQFCVFWAVEFSLIAFQNVEKIIEQI